MEHTALLALTSATLAQIGLTAHILFLRSLKRQAYLPLAIFLIAIGVMVSWPITSIFIPQLQSKIIALSFPALLVLGPSLWLYVAGITSETPWRFRAAHYRHFLPFGSGVIIAFITFCFPYEMAEALLVRGEESGFNLGSGLQRNIAMTVITIAFVMILAWVAQSTYYFVRIIRHLARYRLRLKDVFASTESREMKWLTWLLFAVGAVWSITVITIVSDNLFHQIYFSKVVSSGLLFMMMWSLSVWGLRQKPGFEVLYKEGEYKEDGYKEDKDEGGAASEDGTAGQKYMRSALSGEQSARIAEKIEMAMNRDKLYLDSSLSLRKLANHISVSPNYISQTLNETMGVSFFDYVNKHRVEEAKTFLIQGEASVLDIAMKVGFNAKSSFYTAFKKETQQTPTSFRKEK